MRRFYLLELICWSVLGGTVATVIGLIYGFGFYRGIVADTAIMSGGKVFLHHACLSSVAWALGRMWYRMPSAFPLAIVTLGLLPLWTLALDLNARYVLSHLYIGRRPIPYCWLANGTSGHRGVGRRRKRGAAICSR